MSTASVTQLAPTDQTNGVEIPPALLAKLAEPGVADALTSLLSHADLVAILVEGLDGLVGRSEVIGDSLMGGIAELRSSVDTPSLLGEVDVPALTRSLTSLANASPSLAGLLTSGLIDDVQPLIRGLSRGNELYAANPVDIGGAFSLLKLLKDPDIHRTVSYLATLAKAIGQEIAVSPPGSASPTTRPSSTTGSTGSAGSPASAQ